MEKVINTCVSQKNILSLHPKGYKNVKNIVKYTLKGIITYKY